MNDTPIKSDHPMARAWDQYKKTGEYENSVRWAVHHGPVENTIGSLFVAFVAGWRAAEREKERDREDLTKSALAFGVGALVPVPVLFAIGVAPYPSLSLALVALLYALLTSVKTRTNKEHDRE